MLKFTNNFSKCQNVIFRNNGYFSKNC